MISSRATEWTRREFGLMKGLNIYLQNPYNSTTNPTGIINLGSAENELMFKDLELKFKQSLSLMNVSVEDIRYGDFQGNLELRKHMALFFRRFFCSDEPVDVEPEDICVTNGCGSAVEILFNVLADPGDYVMIPSPYYGGFEMDLETRSKVNILPFKLGCDDVFQQNKDRIKCILLVNPDNPTGTILESSKVLDLIEFCTQKNIHLVVDEIYACSIFRNQQKFKSVLNFIKNQMNVHFLWSMSKDFCLNGIRVGCIVTKNPMVMKALKAQSYFTGVSSLTQKLVSELIMDLDWCNSFFNKNRKALLENYEYLLERISKFNSSLSSAKAIRWVEADAGFFIWLDLSDFLVEHSLNAEKDFFISLLQEGNLYIAPGFAFNSDDSFGRFRLVFGTDKNILNLSLERLFSFLTCKLND